MGNRLPGSRSRRKPSSSATSTAAAHVTPFERSTSSAGGHGVGSGVKPRSSAGVRLRNVVNGRMSVRSPRHAVASCPDLGSPGTTTGGRGGRSSERIPYGGGKGPDTTVLPPAVSTPVFGDVRPTNTGSSSPRQPIGVTVYRSYSSATAADVAGPTVSLVSIAADYRDDEAVFTSGTGSRLDVVEGGTATAPDSVPDIKIYRRSAVLYDDDEDDEDLDDGKKLSSNRVPPRSRSAADVISTGVKLNHVVGRKNMAADKILSSNGKTVKKSASATVDCNTTTSGYRVTSVDFPDPNLIDDRLRRFEKNFIDALLRRYRSKPSCVQRLSAVSLAIHLQSRPRRTVSLLQYLRGSGTRCQSGDASMPTVPVELIDPNGDNTGEYIVTIPDGLFHVVRLARLQYAARLSNTSVSGAADFTGNARDDENAEDLDSGELELWSRIGEEIVRCVGIEAGRELARMFEYQIGLLAEDTAVRMLADHAVECSVAYIERQSTTAPTLLLQQQQQQLIASSSVTASSRPHRQQKNVASSRRGGVWERNSVVRGAVFGAVFGHTETSATVETSQATSSAAVRDGGVGVRNGVRCQRAAVGRQVSVVVGQRELKWDVGDILKRPGLRCDRLLYAADLSVVADAPPSPPPPFTGPNRRRQRHQQPHHASTSGIDVTMTSSDRPREPATASNLGGGSLCQLPSVASASNPSATDSVGLRRTGSDLRNTVSSSSMRSPWTFHVSAACDARLYGYRGQLLDWDYFAHVYAPVPDDEGWFDQPAPAMSAVTSSLSVDEDFHQLYRPRRCLVGTELMQSYCSGTSTAEHHHPPRHQTRPPRPVVRTSSSDKSVALTDFVAARIGESTNAVEGPTFSTTTPKVVPVYRPLKALSLGTASRLRRADFSAADLTRVRLVGADMRRTGLRSSLLSFARLTGVRLGSMNGATVAGSDLSYAVLDDVELPSELRLVGDDLPPFQTASMVTTTTTVKALYAVIETTVDINSPDGASDDIDLYMQSGMKQLSVCAPFSGVITTDELISLLRRQVHEARVHRIASGHQSSTDTAALPLLAVRSDVVSRGTVESPAAELIVALSTVGQSSVKATSADAISQEAASKIEAQSKTKKKKLKKKRFGFGRSVDDRSNKTAASDVCDQQGVSRSGKTTGSSSSDDGKEKATDKAKKKKTRKPKNKDESFQTATVTDVIAEEEVDGNKLQVEPVAVCNDAESDHGVISVAEHPTVGYIDVPRDVRADHQPEVHQQLSHEVSSVCVPPKGCSTVEVTTAGSFRSDSSRPVILSRQVDDVNTKLADESKVLIDNFESFVTQKLQCSVQKGPELHLRRRPDSASKPEISQHHNEDGDANSLSPIYADSPTRRLLGSLSGTLSPPLPVRTYGKNTNAGYLGDVHGSLPVLTTTAVTTTLTVPDWKYSTTNVDDNIGARCGVEVAVSKDSQLPKSVSLQGNQLLTVASTNFAAISVRRRPAADSNCGVGGIGRRKLSRLDVEHINRSQIFRMIADLTIKPLGSVIPEVDPLMTGREQEIDDIIDLISTSGRVVTLTGGYGSGKSALAIAVAHVLSDPSVFHSPRSSSATMTSFVAIHIDLLGCRTTEGVFRRTVRAFDVRFRFDERRLLYNWINARDQRLLIVYDNLDDLIGSDSKCEVDRLSGLVDEIATRVRSIRILLVGGRKRFYRGVGAGSEVYRVGDVGLEVPSELFGRLLPDLHADGFVKLAEACGNVPLALRIAAAALTPSSGVLVDSGRLFESLTMTSEPFLTGAAIECIERLADGDEYQLQRLRLVARCLMKVIDALGDVTSEVLRSVTCFASSFDWRSVAAVLPEGAEYEVVCSELDRLVAVGLAVLVGGGFGSAENETETSRCRRYRLPVLVRSLAVTTALPSEVGRTNNMYRREVLRRLSVAFDRYHEGADGYSMAREDVEVEYDNIVDVLWKTVDREDAFVELSYLATVEGSVFAAEFFPDELYTAVYEAIEREADATDERTDAVEATGEKCTGDRKLLVSRALACLSYRHSLSGRSTEAVLSAEQAVDLARQTLTQSNVDRMLNADDCSDEVSRSSSSNTTMAMALFYLSRAQWVSGEHRKSVATGKRAFEAWKCDRQIVTSSSSKARPSLYAKSGSTDTLVSLPTVSAVYAGDWYAWTLMKSDNFQTARHCYNVSDAVVRDQLSGHPMTIDGLDSRRSVWDRLSLFERAAAAARTACDTARRHIGDHPRTASLLARLGDSIVKRGSLNDAILAVVDALRMRLSVLGTRHRDTADSYRTLAYLMLRTGQYDQAERFARAAIESASAAATTSTRRSPSDDDDDDDDVYEDDGNDGGSSSMRVGGGGEGGVDENGPLLERIATEAQDIISQARYRTECRSSVFVQLETRMDHPDDIETRRVGRKL